MAIVTLTCDEQYLNIPSGNASPDCVNGSVSAWQTVPYDQLPPYPLSDNDLAWLLMVAATFFLISFAVRILLRLILDKVKS